MQRYLVMTLRTPDFQASAIEPHYAFLDRLRQDGKLELAGPFTDKSGGAYLIRANDINEAKAIAFSDPVHTSGSSKVTVYEWDAKA
ncbi:YciI family protein [Mangrovitalea sediminis]|uniref:YciI family protein n=1 Tax=Mangrovitalea sediminis TaxID=1982043 RepID=UPI000BE57A79|nr:YciI family protein [Mangrovitalea sediminis]